MGQLTRIKKKWAKGCKIHKPKDFQADLQSVIGIRGMTGFRHEMIFLLEKDLSGVLDNALYREDISVIQSRFFQKSAALAVYS